jgi:hypothetical protein
VLVRADHPALEHAEEAFERVRVYVTIGHVRLVVIDALILREARALYYCTPSVTRRDSDAFDSKMTTG